MMPSKQRSTGWTNKMDSEQGIHVWTSDFTCAEVAEVTVAMTFVFFYR